MKRLLLATLLASAALLCACPSSNAPVIINLAETTVTYNSADYETVLDRWTRHDVGHLRFDTALDVTATYRSWDYREAYIAHFADLYSLDDAERQAKEKSEADDERQVAEFHVCVRATKDEWTELGTKDSVWRISLQDDQGHKVLPSDVRDDRTPDTEIHAFFPYTTAFSRSYNIRFPRALPDGSLLLAPGTAWFELHFDGPLGHVVVHWDVTPVSGKQPSKR
jgi:hypothetical protein